MSENDIERKRVHPEDVIVALGLLTRLPLPARPLPDRGGQSAWAYPVAGLVIACCGGLALGLAGALGFSAGFAAAMALAVTAMVSGAMHEDGLADTADGLWGGWEKARRLDIMKDSQIGTYGVLALILSVLARWSLLSMAIQANAGFGALVAAAMISRAPMVALTLWLPNARGEGLSHHVGRSEGLSAAIAAGVAFVGAMLAVGSAAPAALILAFLVAGGLGLVAKAKIGGQTGDILGASQQLAEIAALAVIVANLG